MANYPFPFSNTIPHYPPGDGYQQNQYTPSSLTAPPQPFAAFQHNAGLPAVDVHTFSANAAQFSALFNSLQSGMIPPPPIPPAVLPQSVFAPPPPLSFGPPTLHQPAFLSNVADQLHDRPQPAQSLRNLRGGGLPSNRITELAGSDREEGELSDREGASTSPDKRPPTVVAIPRSIGASHADPIGDPSTSNSYTSYPQKHDSQSHSSKRVKTAADASSRYSQNDHPAGSPPLPPSQPGSFESLHKHDYRSPLHSSRQPYSQQHNKTRDKTTRVPSTIQPYAYGGLDVGAPARKSAGDTPFVRPDQPQGTSRARAIHGMRSPHPPNTPSTKLGLISNSDPINPMSEATPWEPPHTRRDKAKEFIALMNDNNYGFADLAKEGLDRKLLRELYKELSISIPLDSANPPPESSTMENPQSTSPSINQSRVTAARIVNNGIVATTGQSTSTGARSANSVAQRATASQPSSSQAPNVSSALETTVVTKAESPKNATSASAIRPGPANARNTTTREAYVARLNALKAARNPKPITSGATAHEKIVHPKPIAEPEPRSEIPTKAQVAEQLVNGVSTASEAATLAAQKKRAQTELARQRMEALAAARKPTTNTGLSTPRNRSQSATSQDLSDQQDPTIVRNTEAEKQSEAESDVSSLHKQTHANLTSAATSQAPQVAANIAKNRHNPENTNKPFFAGIPGLFMTAGEQQLESGSSTTAESVQPQKIGSVTATKDKKRRVAADFDNLETSQALNTPKRAFGGGRSEQIDEALIIEVSDEDSADSIMELEEEEEAAAPQSIPSSLPLQAEAKRGGLRDMPALTGFPQRLVSEKQGSSIPSSVLSTPSAVQTPSTTREMEELRKKEEEISNMKKRIAELVQRKLAGKEKLQADAARAPVTPNTTTDGSTAVLQPIATAERRAEEVLGDNLGSAKSQVSPVQREKESPVLANSEDPKPADATIAPLHAPNSSTGAATEWRKRRRAEIESGLPALDAGLASNLSRLAELRREMEQLEVENERRLKDKQELIKELEELGIDTDGMPHEELKAMKDEIVQQRETEGVAPATDVSDQAVLRPPTPIPVVAESTMPASEDAPTEYTSVVEEHVSKPEDASSPLSGTHVSISGSLDAHDGRPDFVDDAMDMSEGESEEGEINGDSRRSTSASSTELAELPREPPSKSEAAPATDVPASGSSDRSDGEHVEDMYGLKDSLIGQSQAASDQNFVTVPPADVDMTDGPTARSSLEQEDVHMESTSSGESDEYEPPDVNATLPSKPVLPPSEDDYEPSDAVLSPPALPDAVPTHIKEASPSSAEIDMSATNVQLTPIADDLASELQPETALQEVVSKPIPFQLSKEAQFAPYESPLRMFKAYRYHPDYRNDVSGGFRSMTFSNTIDANKPLCQFEAAGGTCNDDQCNGQHFRNMGLSDDQILLRLGTDNPGHNEEEKRQWTDGLKDVIKDLRMRGVQDPNTVLAEIVEYRRRFLKDPTKVLNL